MHKKLLFLILLLQLVTSVRSTGQTLDSALETIFEDFELMGMSVALSTNGSASSYHYGLRDLDRGLEVDANTRYRIASVSKAFSALGLLKLYDDGAFELDDDISTYLGINVRNPNFPDSPITFRMLLSHSSSIQDGSGYDDFLNATYTQTPIPNISEILQPGGAYFTSDMYRQEPPGSFFAYSNLNFGLVGTLIEAISGQRFDQYMKTEILEPLGTQASFNIQDIPDINDVAVLYRNIGGWQPQIDNYQGIYPTAPDLSAYLPGTNGLYFAPQGGLRASALEVQKLLDFLQNGNNGGDLQIGQETLDEMKEIQWDYNGSNGDNYFGLFNRWGLGLHHANVNQGDQICLQQNFGTFLGHPGEAYGLISDAYFGEDEPVSLVLLINGSWPGYEVGDQTAFYRVEEAVFQTVCSHFENLSVVDPSMVNWSAIPNPSAGNIRLTSPEASSFSYTLRSVNGRIVKQASGLNPGSELTLGPLPAGLYLMEIRWAGKVDVLKIMLR